MLLGIGIAENRLPAGWEKTRYAIDNSGLRAAVTWRARQLASEAAYVLPDAIRK